MAKKRKRPEPEVVGFLGIGLDNQDEHQRLTRSEHFVLVGGSQDTHEQMQDTAIRFGESLEKTGKTLQEVPLQQILELLYEARQRS